MYKKALGVVFFPFLLLACGDGDYSNVTPQVAAEIRSLPSGRRMFLDAIRHYQKTGDSSGLNCVLFLLQGIGHHYTVTSTDGKDQYDSIPDCQQLDAGYLINNIDLARKISNRLLSSRVIGMHEFYEYVLPYRLGTEPLNVWRQDALDTFGNLVRDSISLYNSSYPLQVASLLNNYLRHTFKYASNTKAANECTWGELMKNKRGDCDVMTDLIAYPLRAWGVPATVDFVPQWSNLKGGHSWNVLLSADGRSIPFMGCESNPGEYSPFLIFKDISKTPTKIFRKTYSGGDANIKYLKDHNWLNALNIPDDNIEDVTSLYVQTSDIEIKVTGIPDSAIVLLGICKKGSWRPVYGAPAIKNKVTFGKMASNVIYLALTVNENGAVTYLSNPLITLPDGTYRYLNTTEETTTDMEIRNLNSKQEELQDAYASGKPWPVTLKKLDSVYSDLGRNKPQRGRKYRLLFWDKGWQLAASAVCTDSLLKFCHVPANEVYMLENEEGFVSERPFIYENNEQIWF